MASDGMQFHPPRSRVAQSKCKLANNCKLGMIAYGSTGEIGPGAKGYANKVMGDSNLSIVLINGGDLKAIEAHPAAIVDVFNLEAAHAMKLKALDL